MVKPKTTRHLLIIQGKDTKDAHKTYGTDMRKIERWAQDLPTGGGTVNDITAGAGIRLTPPTGDLSVSNVEVINDGVIQLTEGWGIKLTPLPARGIVNISAVYTNEILHLRTSIGIPAANYAFSWVGRWRFYTQTGTNITSYTTVTTTTPTFGTTIQIHQDGLYIIESSLSVNCTAPANKVSYYSCQINYPSVLIDKPKVFSNQLTLLYDTSGTISRSMGCTGISTAYLTAGSTFQITFSGSAEKPGTSTGSPKIQILTAIATMRQSA